MPSKMYFFFGKEYYLSCILGKMLVFVHYDARPCVRQENTSLSTGFLLTVLLFFQCTVTGEQAARALQHEAEISWKKMSSICREVSKHYTKRSGCHKDRTIGSCAPDRISGTGNKF